MGSCSGCALGSGRALRQVHVSYVAEARLPGKYVAPAAVVTDLAQLVVFGASSTHVLVVL
jgi:hypothetical protein